MHGLLVHSFHWFQDGFPFKRNHPKSYLQGFTFITCKKDNVIRFTMDFYGRCKHKSPTKKRRDKLKKHRFLAEFQKDPVLVPVPISEFNPSNDMPCNISRREFFTSCSMCHVQSRAKFAGSAGSSVTIGVLEVPANTKCVGGIRLHEQDVGGPP